MSDDDARVRSDAAWSIGQLKPESEDIAGRLISLLADEDRDVRENASEALRHLGSAVVAGHIPRLIPLVEHREPNVRAVTTKVFVALDHPNHAKSVIPLLVKRSQVERQTFVQEEIARTLGKLGVLDIKTTLPALWPLLRDSNQWWSGDALISESVREAAIESLATLAKADPTLVQFQASKLTDDAEAGFRAAILRLLGRIAGETSLEPGLIKKLKMSISDPQEQVRQAAVEALGASVLHQGRLDRSLPNTFSGLLNLLSGDESRLDGQYRRAVIFGLATWYNAGHLEGEETTRTAGPSNTSSVSDPEAAAEHVSLQQSLDRLCVYEIRLWLRAAACEVLVTAYRQRLPRDYN